MSFASKISVLIISLFLLVSCTRPKVPFLSDPLILRGNWIATISDAQSETQTTTVRFINIEATFIDKDSYGIKGQVQFGSDAPLALSGTIISIYHEYVNSQTTQFIGEELYVTANNQDNSATTGFCYYINRLIDKYEGSVGNIAQVENRKVCQSPENKQKVVLQRTS